MALRNTLRKNYKGEEFVAGEVSIPQAVMALRNGAAVGRNTKPVEFQYRKQ